MAISIGNYYTPHNTARVTFVTSGGDVYVVLREEGATDYLHCFKKTDSSFSEQDSADAPSASDINDFDARIDTSDIIHIAYAAFDGTNYHVKYVTFATSTNQWSGSTYVAADVTTDHYFEVGISLDLNDKPHVAYVILEKITGKYYDHIKYKNKTGASWSAEESITGGTKDFHKHPSVGHESDDRFVVIWWGPLGAAKSRTRSNGGTWDTQGSIASNIGEMLCLTIQTNDKPTVATPNNLLDLHVYEGTAGANPSWSTEPIPSITTINDPSIIHNGTDLYVIYIETTADNVLMIARKGGTWDSSPTTLQSSADLLSAVIAQDPTLVNDFDYLFRNVTEGITYWDEHIFGAPPAYYHGLKVQGEGELALCDVGSHPLRIRKGSTTYGIELVAIDDPNASAARVKTEAGIKSIRKYT